MLTKADALVKTFLKHETSTTLTDPRNISPRTDEFLAAIGPYISAIEHHAADLPFLVKGLDLAGRDIKMNDLCDYPTLLETDYSRFDMTISAQWLECVQNPLLEAFYPHDDVFKHVLHLAMQTRGVSDCGYNYTINGTRCSGDAHTSIGNGFINAFNTWSLFKDLPEDSWCHWHEGDDGIAGFLPSVAKRATDVTLMDIFGFTVKALVSNNIEDVTFCGRFFAVTSKGLRSYCDPVRTLSKLHITLKQGRTPELLLAKALSYRYTDGSTPIIGPVCSAIIANTKGRLAKAAKFCRDDRWLLDEVAIKDIISSDDKEVETDLRVPFARRTGISPSDQEKMEAYYIKAFTGGVPASILKLATEDQALEEDGRELHFMPTMHVM